MFNVYDANGCLLSKMATQQHRSKYDVSMKTLYGGVHIPNRKKTQDWNTLKVCFCG